MDYHVTTMFLRVTAAKGHRYVQLVHNYRDPATRVTKTRVLHNFGREDQLDVDALRRLVQSISRFLDPPSPQDQPPSDATAVPFRFLGGRGLGGVWLLDQLWHDLGFTAAVGPVLQATASGAAVERWLFAAVAASMLAPHGDVPLADWVRDHVFVPDLAAGEPDEAAAAARLLSSHLRIVERGLHESMSRWDEVAVETLYFATVPIGETLGAGPVTLGLVVTETGLPVRLWLWPGSLAAPQLAEQVRVALGQSGLGHRLVAFDAGAAPAGSLRTSHGGGELLVVCEQLAGPSGATAGPGGQVAPQPRRSSLASEIREMIVERTGSRQRARVIYNFPLRNAGDEVTADQIALGMRQANARAVQFGALKQGLDGYTVDMGFEDRVRIHSLTRWLALLLMHEAARRTGRAWQEIASTMESLQVGILQAGDLEIWQATPLTVTAGAMLAAVGADPPPQCLKVEPHVQPGQQRGRELGKRQLPATPATG
jgi:hypothetical protein